MAAAGDRPEVLVARGVADAVDDHVGAAEPRLHGIGEAMVRRHDRMRATVLARDASLLFARHRADHHGAELPGPRGDEQADAACGRVHEEARSGADVAEVAQQDVGGDALQQRRRCNVVLDRRGQTNDPLG